MRWRPFATQVLAHVTRGYSSILVGIQDERKDATMKLMELYQDKIVGAIKGLDRIRFRGTLRWLATRKLDVVMAPRKCVWLYHYFDDPVLGFGQPHAGLQGVSLAGR
jgi:hypothetical protein